MINSYLYIIDTTITYYMQDIDILRIDIDFYPKRLFILFSNLSLKNKICSTYLDQKELTLEFAFIRRSLGARKGGDKIVLTKYSG